MLFHNVHHRMLVGLLLVLLMVVTRGHYVQSIPDASWAVFFLAGVYLYKQWFFLVLCALVTLIDWIAISWGGVSGFCVTPAYAMLLPAYASLWLWGRWYAMRQRHTVSSFTVVVFIAALQAELFSSGGFYFLGGRFDEPTLMGFIQRLVDYFPQNLNLLLLYIGLAGLFQGAFVLRTQHRHV